MNTREKKLTLIAYGIPISSIAFGDNCLSGGDLSTLVTTVDNRGRDDTDVPNFCHFFNDRNMLQLYHCYLTTESILGEGLEKKFYLIEFCLKISLQYNCLQLRKSVEAAINHDHI